MSRIALVGLAVLAVVGSVLTVTVSSADTQRDVIGKLAATAAPAVIDVSAYRVDGRSDSQAIEAAISSARRGDTLSFPDGDYVLDAPIRLKSHVNYVGGGQEVVTIRSAAAEGLTISHGPKTPLRDVTIRGMTFDNISMRFTGDPGYGAIADITITDCRFTNGLESKHWLAAYVTLVYTDGVTVDGCEFLRTKGHGGRGIVADKTRLTVVKDSFIGTTADLESSVANGYFRTAINVAGHELATGTGNREVIIDGNTWRRKPGAEEPPDCEGCQDHGLYAWGTTRLFAVGNRADGWDASSAGGAMKLRNQSDTFVIGNHLRSSGILTYVYDSPNMPNHLDRMMIRDNVINMAGTVSSCGNYCGINYWRNFGTGGSGHEEDVYIRGNRFTDGGAITLADAYGPSFCIDTNTDALLTFFTGGVQTDGCDDAVPWDEPIAGVHRGDFDGDGGEDYVHAVRRDDGSRYWRFHMSDGDGYSTEEQELNFYASEQTAAYGAHVGDFDGDGRDDLTYYGRCGDGKACWRMHLGTPQGLSEPADWGDHVYASPETSAHGFHVGDFDGSGSDDITFRGRCGQGEPCWRVLFGDAESFRPQAGGDDARWSAADEGAFGLLIGDFDGDDTDDIALRGVCDPRSTPCFRVHLGSADGFTAQSWGDGGYFAAEGTSAHFGMEVGDKNGDGRTDITYLGRCGPEGRTQWRHHLSTGSGFTVDCSPDFELAPTVP